jgi:hypothetical protein
MTRARRDKMDWGKLSMHLAPVRHAAYCISEALIRSRMLTTPHQSLLDGGIGARIRLRRMLIFEPSRCIELGKLRAVSHALVHSIEHKEGVAVCLLCLGFLPQSVIVCFFLRGLPIVRIDFLACTPTNTRERELRSAATLHCFPPSSPFAAAGPNTPSTCRLPNCSPRLSRA